MSDIFGVSNFSPSYLQQGPREPFLVPEVHRQGPAFAGPFARGSWLDPVAVVEVERPCLAAVYGVVEAVHFSADAFDRRSFQVDQDEAHIN